MDRQILHKSLNKLLKQISWKIEDYHTEENEQSSRYTRSMMFPLPKDQKEDNKEISMLLVLMKFCDQVITKS